MPKVLVIRYPQLFQKRNKKGLRSEHQGCLVKMTRGRVFTILHKYLSMEKLFTELVERFLTFDIPDRSLPLFVITIR